MSLFEAIGDTKSILQLVIFSIVFSYVVNFLSGVSTVFHTMTHPYSWFEKSKETLKTENTSLYVTIDTLEARMGRMQGTIDNYQAEDVARHKLTWTEWAKGDSTRLQNLDSLEHAGVQVKKSWKFW